MDIIQSRWQEILNTVKEEHELTDISFRTWLQPLEVFHVDQAGRVVTILVPSQEMGVSYIRKKYMYPLKVAIAEITGIEYEVEFILPDQADSTLFSESSSNTINELSANLEKAHLNPKYTFDTFVVGGNNKFAHAAALAVAESPGKMYNPLFIYGESGLGKTHLMHSIGNFILTQNPRMKVLYVTSETFTIEVIDGIRNGNNTTMTSFREKYRNVDVLLIDDIQFIIGKEATQEEFFHTFNYLREKNKQIIISSDKPPKEMETLESRLRNRFEWGILTDIGAPDFETRMAILHKKEETEGIQINPKIIEYIATNITSNIRELEGALNKVIAMGRLNNREITEALAEEALRDMISPNQKQEITVDYIVDTVAEHFHIQPSDILGKNKSSRVTLPRQIVMYLCRYNMDISLQDIAFKLGKKDHTTIMHGVAKIEEGMQTSESLRSTIDIIRKKISPS